MEFNNTPDKRTIQTIHSRWLRLDNQSIVRQTTDKRRFFYVANINLHNKLNVFFFFFAQQIIDYKARIASSRSVSNPFKPFGVALLT